MNSQKEFEISFSGLKEGSHEFDFTVDMALFEGREIEDMVDCGIGVEVLLTKTSNMLVLDFEIDGKVKFPCDRCLENTTIPIRTEEKLFVKFGFENGAESEDVIILKNTAYKVNFAQQLYEYIVLALPQKKVHEENLCDPEVIEQLNKHQHGESEELDPRWLKLDELKQ